MDRLSVSTVVQGKNQKWLQSEISVGFRLKFKIQNTENEFTIQRLIQSDFYYYSVVCI